MKINKTICDCCTVEIVRKPGYPINDHISISAVPSQTEYSDSTYLVQMRRKLDRTYEFCDLDCLTIWLRNRKNLLTNE